MEEEVTYLQIELNPENNEFYMFCQKNRDRLLDLLREGFFDIKGGRAIVDFNTGGGVDGIIRVLYNKQSDKLKDIGIPNV